MDYVWSGYNEQGNTIDISSSINGNNDQPQLTQQQQQQVDEYKHFQMTIYNYLINLHKEFEYELDRVTREHELQLFKVNIFIFGMCFIVSDEMLMVYYVIVGTFCSGI
ncbi:unnamed protein product [Schistosoma rodhaini]|uniref:Uncharacterized protein n=1 Tax=Schistosoma rodhaini TaxID=6188 RepID=A0AA85FCJ1_9TREM|nr:unnamed protein product [Schistosoma rodhaini]